MTPRRRADRQGDVGPWPESCLFPDRVNPGSKPSVGEKADVRGRHHARRQCANTGRSPMARGKGQIAPSVRSHLLKGRTPRRSAPRRRAAFLVSTDRGRAFDRRCTFPPLGSKQAFSPLTRPRVPRSAASSKWAVCELDVLWCLHPNPFASHAFRYISQSSPGQVLALV